MTSYKGWPEWVVERRGTVTVPYVVGYYQYEGEQERHYDYKSSVEDIEAHEWFETADAAEDEIRRRLGA